MPGAERNGEGYLRGMSVEWLAVEFVAVTQQHAEQQACNTTVQGQATDISFCNLIDYFFFGLLRAQPSSLLFFDP